MIRFYEPETSHWRQHTGLEKHCVFRTVHGCKELATYDKVYSSRFFFIPLSEIIPYCSYHKKKDEYREKLQRNYGKENKIL